MTKSQKISSAKIFIIIIAFILIIVLAVGFTYKSVLRNIYPHNYTEYIDKYSQQYDVPKDLLFATIKTESGFDEKAHSSAGAMGLTQITPDTFSWLQTKTGEKLSPEDLNDPEISIKYCAVFYNLLLSEFGNTRTAIAAYHAGRSQVNSWLGDTRYSPDGVTLTNIPSSATGHYVSKVTKAINIYNNLYKEEL